MTTQSFARLGNRRSVRLDTLPLLGAEELGVSLANAVASGWRIVSLFGTPETGDALRIIAVLADDEHGRLVGASAIVPEHYPSLSARCAPAALFEREVAEQCGATPDGHPGLIPFRRHPADHRPAKWSARPVQREQHQLKAYEGADVHELAVGPVHAGIIEPGHFRFQAYGEEVLALEIVLGYQHRGIETLLEAGDPSRRILVAESIAGDTVIAHASAYCGAIEALARARKGGRAQGIRSIALELERLANHVGDLGALAGDIAFQPAAAYFGRLRGECLNMLMTLSGNRYGRGLIRPGGVSFDVTPPMSEELSRRARTLARELRPVAELFFGTASVQSRLEGIGVVPREACDALGLVGVTARACEVPRDTRHDHPYGAFRFSQIPVATAWAGDVYARALVRWLEIQRSLEFVDEQLASLPAGDLRVACPPLAPSELVVALEEGWRGEVVHVALTDDQGRIRRHKVTDPSFRNWPALAAAMPGNQVSDFPLCNKSFNLSYAGNDL